MVLEVPLLVVPVGSDLHDVDHRVVGRRPQAQGGAGRGTRDKMSRLEGGISLSESKLLQNTWRCTKSVSGCD